jgi:hypothetical protein
METQHVCCEVGTELVQVAWRKRAVCCGAGRTDVCMHFVGVGSNSRFIAWCHLVCDIPSWYTSQTPRKFNSVRSIVSTIVLWRVSAIIKSHCQAYVKFLR